MQALKDYDEILKRYEDEHSDDESEYEDAGWSLNE